MRNCAICGGQVGNSKLCKQDFGMVYALCQMLMFNPSVIPIAS
jgi:hypothetical protein